MIKNLEKLCEVLGYIAIALIPLTGSVLLVMLLITLCQMMLK